MTQQNQRLHPDIQPSQPRLLTPGNKLIKRKLCQLQNKAHFFQGQINPLLGQNQKLKAQLTILNKSVIASTDLLRSLLPIGSSQSKKLKLQLASIEQISEMIKQDWYLMEDQIKRKTFAIQVLEKKMLSNKEEYQKEFSKFKDETEMLINEKNEQMERMREEVKQAQLKLEQTVVKCKKEIADIKEYFRMRVERAERLEAQFEIFRHEVRNRNESYQKAIQRLKDEISSNLIQFQEGKKNLREIYEKLMSEKMAEQAQGFDLLLKTKEEQKDRLMFYYQEREEDLQSCLQQKSETIEKMQETVKSQLQRIRQRQQTINIRNSTIKQLNSEINSRLTEIQHLKTTNSLLQGKIDVSAKQFLTRQKQLEQQMRLTAQKQAKLEKQLNSRIQNLTKLNIQANNQLQQKTQRLKATQKSLVTAQRRFNKRLEQEQLKWSAQKQLLQERSKELEQEVQKKQLELEQNHKLLNLNSEQFKQQLLLQQEQRKKQLQEMVKSHQSQLQEMKQQASREMEFMKKEKDRMLSEERIKNSQEMQKFMLQCNAKLRQKQEQFNFIKKNLNEQLNARNTQLLQQQLEIKSMSEKIKEKQAQIQSINKQHLMEVSKIKQEAKRQLEQLQAEKQLEKKKIQQQMINQLMEFKLEMENRQAEYETTLKKIQTEMMNEINMLKSSNAIDQLESKHLAQLERIKKDHQSFITNLQEKQKQSQQSLIQEQKRRIQELILQYEEDMTKLAKKLESDISILNLELMEEQQQHEITKMTRQEKIIYLSKKIHQLKIVTEQKQNKILQLMLEIQQYKKEQDRINEIIEERVAQRKTQLEIQKKEFIRQCKVEMDKTRSQAQKRITQVQKDRFDHTQTMYQKFNQLKEFHQQELSRLQTRYNQLQRLFQERPSRAQDLSKIKQLIEMKQKMDIEIKHYHKKVQHANQIVKYLNLQLQNYKDSYDIFGPGDQGTQSKPMVIENSNSKNDPSMGSIIKLRKISQRANTEGVDRNSSFVKYESISPKLMNRATCESPDIKEFQLNPNSKFNQSQTLIPTQQAQFEPKSRRLRRSPQNLTRSKKQRSLDKSTQIVLNAENFLKLIRDNKNPTPNIKEKSVQRRAYRKSRPRRLNTMIVNSGQMFSFVTKKSLNPPDNLDY